MAEIFRAISRRTLVGAGLALVSGAALAACASDNKKASSSARTSVGEDPTAVATDAYVFGYPLVLMDATRAAGGPPNQFMHADALPTPDDRVVVRMNLDTLYSQAWLDLTAEPLVMQIPSMESGRYWLMQMLDAWTNTAHNPSSVRPQVKSGHPTPPFTYLITGPGWTGTVPDAMTHLPMPTNTVWVIGRTQVNGHDDIPAVRAIQQKMKLAPLSGYQANPDIATPGVVPGAGQKHTSPADEVAAMDGPTFFAKLCALMATNPPTAADDAALKRFAALGITPSGTPSADATVLNAGVQAGKTQVAAYKDPAAKNVNGWLYATDLGAYGTNYPLRAYTAFFGLGANLADDALYPTLFGVADANGAPQRFRLQFAKDQLPPVEAFWSITAYDAASFLIANPANIYAVGHQIPIAKNPDGSADLTVQHADPGPAVPAGNWLPIPATGKFSLTLRLYAPKPAAAQGEWQPPKLEGIS